MAVPDVLSADAVAPRLDYLLQRARVVKPSTSIDPPLQVSELVPENEPLLGKIEGGDQIRTLAVESAAKSVFYANLVSHYVPLPVPHVCLHAQGSTRIEEPAFVTVWNLLDILQYCGDRGMLHSGPSFIPI
jgi:THO complex subunit 1